MHDDVVEVCEEVFGVCLLSSANLNFFFGCLTSAFWIAFAEDPTEGLEGFKCGMLRRAALKSSPETASSIDKSGKSGRIIGTGGE